MEKKIFFLRPLSPAHCNCFEVDNPGLAKKTPGRQANYKKETLTSMPWWARLTIHSWVSRTDMNHAAELYVVNLTNGDMRQLTHVNDAVYSSLGLR